MGLFEDILARSRPDWQPVVDPAFPELKPEAPLPEPAADASWLKTMMQNAAITKQRKDRSGQATISGALADVDPSLGIKQALASVPGIGAGMLGGGEAPMPAARPAGAPGPVYPDDRGSPAPQPMAALPSTTSTEVSSRNGGPAPAVPAAPTQTSPRVAQPQAAPAEPSVFDKIMRGLSNNSNTLLALGAGFAGAPNIGQGISRAASAAIPARAADIAQQTQLSGQAGLQQALIDAGVPRQQAFAAVGNPKLAEALIQSYVTDRGKDVQLIKSKDMLGNETEVPYIKDKYAKDNASVLTPAFKDDQGNAAPAPGVNASNPSGTDIYAPGINQNNFDHSKTGDEYLAQLSPEVQSDVRSRLEGRSLPPGRQKGLQMIDRIAKKYGDDIGMAADDASIGQRKQWSSSLGDTKSGVGLQSKGLHQGLEHFVGLSDNLVKMNLSNGLGLEPVAGVINSAKNLTTEQQRLVHKNDVFGQALSREMGNLFSKNGGGVHEAAETKKHISNSTMSSKSAAGSLEGIDELMQGGLRALEERRDQLFPNGKAPKGSEFMGPKQQEQLAHIRRNIAILKGEKVDAAPAANDAAPKPGGHYRLVNGVLVEK